MTVRSGIDGRVRNAGVARYAGLGDQHLVTVGGEADWSRGKQHVIVEWNTIELKPERPQTD